METGNNIVLKIGFYSSLFLVILTMVTFGFAIMAVPPAGPYCPGNCMDYPYKDLLLYYPRDYNWMYFAIFQLFAFIVFIVSNYFITPTEKKIFGLISVSFALISATVLLIDYFIQFAIVPISVMKGESEGIALISQYNGHGLFIALEELGYILMSISLLFLALIFKNKTTLEKSIRWILFMPFILTILSFVYYTVNFGLDRSYRFEVAVITINWLAIVFAGILLSIFFLKQIRLKKI